MAKRIYAIGMRRGSRIHYLRTRETNFRRACKTLRDMLKGNKRYKIGHVALVIVGRAGEEKDLKILYSAKSRA